MTGVLALVGGGEWTAPCTFDRALAQEAGATEVVVLPTGAAYERPARLVEQARVWFETMGLTVRPLDVLSRPDAVDPAVAAVVREARFVYLAGSSAMHLRSVLKDTAVFDALLEAWRSGASIAGTNAGADVLCDPMVDSRGGAFTVGLGMVPDLAVIPRSDEWSPDKVHRTVELAPSGVALATVPTATALIRAADGMWRVEGAGEVGVYVGGKRAGLADLPR